jgi:hypothetical protein
MQGARHQFLAGAGFAGHQHRQRRLRQPADRPEQRAHRRRIADQGGEFVGRLRQWRCRQRDLLGLRQRATGQRDGFVQVEGFRQEFVRTTAERTGGAGHVGMRGHHDHRQVRSRLLELVEQHQAAVAGHAHVGDDQRRRAMAGQRIQRLASIAERGHAVAGLAQRGGQHETHRAVVVHDPDVGCIAAHRCLPHRICTMKVHPSPVHRAETPLRPSVPGAATG